MLIFYNILNVFVPSKLFNNTLRWIKLIDQELVQLEVGKFEQSTSKFLGHTFRSLSYGHFGDILNLINVILVVKLSADHNSMKIDITLCFFELQYKVKK